MIQPMVQRLAGDADAGIGHVGEIRQRLLSRHMVLTEDHLTIGAVFGAPGTNPTLQAPTQPIPVMIGMTALHLLEQPQPVASRDAPRASGGSRCPIVRQMDRDPGASEWRLAAVPNADLSRCGGPFAR